MNRKAFGALVTYIAIMGGGIIAIKVLAKATDGPDFTTSMKMRTWNTVKGIAYGQASWWGKVGLNAESQYDRCRG